MAAEDELLKLLDPAIRQRIEGDYDRFAPLLALLGAWQQEIQGHVQQIEQNTVTRLMGELFPKGAWKFPCQTLVVPEDLVRREVTEEMPFMDRVAQTPWTPCGTGWTLPTRLEDWRIESQGWDQRALVCDIQFDSRQPDARLLTPPAPPDDPTGSAQLAFVCGSEEIVAALAASPWALQHPGEPFQPIGVTRYQGYLDFEKGLGAARGKQRQLEAWLPPFYPYSRKFLRFFALSPDATPASAPADWSWLNQGGRGVRLAALVSAEVADYFERRAQTPPLHLNAIPVAQMRVSGEPLVENPDRVGDSYKSPFMGVQGCFAASAREYHEAAEGHSVLYHAARLVSTSSDDGRAQTGLQNVEVLCDRPAGPIADFRVRIYHTCYGENATAPTALTRPNGLRFSAPFPPTGSMDAPIAGYDDAGARRSWYHALLRAPQLTQGDVIEILSQIPDCRRYLELDPDYVSLQLAIENKSWVERAPWDNYLWPCLVSEAFLLEQRATYLTQSRVAVIPVMRLIFEQGRESLPEFLQEDLVRYTASVISQYFMIGWYRVAGQMARK